MIESYVEAIEKNGFAVIPDVIAPEVVAGLIRELEGVRSEGVIRRQQSIYGIRNLLHVAPLVRALADSAPIRSLVEPLLGQEAFVVRSLFFDKSPETNWSVAWHQDLTVAVRERRPVEGFGAWSIKAGVPHALAPVSVLGNMLAVRLHLDDTDSANGALRVLPGSHRFGRLSDEQAERWEQAGSPITCSVAKGGVLVMRPLLLHASSPSLRSAHRS